MIDDIISVYKAYGYNFNWLKLLIVILNRK